jgi:plastocyanin
MMVFRSRTAKFLLLFFFVGSRNVHANTPANSDLPFSGKISFPEGYPEKNNTVIFIDGLKKEMAKSGDETKVIGQKNMQYQPFLTVTTLGSRIIFRNLDPNLHTVKAESGPLMNMKLAMTPVRQQYERIAKAVGVSELLCDIHSQMRAFVVVVPNEYYAITDENGDYTFAKKLPPYPFEIKVWHEILPPVTFLVQSEKDLIRAKEITLRTWEQASR